MFCNDIFSVNLGVYLRCTYIGMTEHFLYHAQICPSFKEMRGKGVTKSMGRNPLGDACQHYQLLDNFPDPDPRKPFPKPIQENNPLPAQALHIASIKIVP